MPQFREQNTELVAIAVQHRAIAEAAIQQTGVSYPILADADHRVAAAYGVYNRLGDGIAAPAVFIINTNGEITWSYIGQNINDRPKAGTILQNLP